MSPRVPMRSHNIRVSDKVWAAAQQKAEENGDNLSEVIRAAIERYVKAK